MIPLLQERGTYRDAYRDGATLRETLGVAGQREVVDA